MKSYRQAENHSRINLKAIIIGIIAALAFTLIGSLAASAIISGSDVGEGFYRYASWSIWALSVIIGCIAERIVSKNNNLLGTVAATVGYVIVLCGIQMLFFDSIFQNLVQGIGIILAGMLLSILLLANKNAGNKKKFRFRK